MSNEVDLQLGQPRLKASQASQVSQASKMSQAFLH